MGPWPILFDQLLAKAVEYCCGSLCRASRIKGGRVLAVFGMS